MSRTFLLFFCTGAAEWLIFGLAAAVQSGYIAVAGLIAVVSAPLVVAVYHWRITPASPFSKAAAGLAVSGAFFYAILWATTIAPYSCPPDDFECLTVGSQWELSLMLVFALTLVSVASAALGAAIGSRLLPRVAA